MVVNWIWVLRNLTQFFVENFWKSLLLASDSVNSEFSTATMFHSFIFASGSALQYRDWLSCSTSFKFIFCPSSGE